MKKSTTNAAMGRLLYAERALRMISDGAGYAEIVAKLGQPRWQSGSKMDITELRGWVISVFSSEEARAEMSASLQAKWNRESHFDPSEVFTLTKTGLKVKNLRAMAPEARQMITSLEQKPDGSVKVTLRDTQRSEDMLARSLGAFKDKLEHSGDASFAALVAASFGQKAPDAKEPSDGE